jgi:hypothetical protein
MALLVTGSIGNGPFFHLVPTYVFFSTKFLSGRERLVPRIFAPTALTLFSYLCNECAVAHSLQKVKRFVSAAGAKSHAERMWRAWSTKLSSDVLRRGILSQNLFCRITRPNITLYTPTSLIPDNIPSKSCIKSCL